MGLFQVDCRIEDTPVKGAYPRKRPGHLRTGCMDCLLLVCTGRQQGRGIVHDRTVQAWVGSFRRWSQDGRQGYTAL